MSESDIFNVDRGWYNRKYYGVLRALQPLKPRHGRERGKFGKEKEVPCIGAQKKGAGT